MIVSSIPCNSGSTCTNAFDRCSGRKRRSKGPLARKFIEQVRFSPGRRVLLQLLHGSEPSPEGTALIALASIGKGTDLTQRIHGGSERLEGAWRRLKQRLGAECHSPLTPTLLEIERISITYKLPISIVCEGKTLDLKSQILPDQPALGERHWTVRVGSGVGEGDTFLGAWKSMLAHIRTHTIRISADSPGSSRKTENCNPSAPQLPPSVPPYWETIVGFERNLRSFRADPDVFSSAPVLQASPPRRSRCVPSKVTLAMGSASPVTIEPACALFRKFTWSYLSSFERDRCKAPVKRRKTPPKPESKRGKAAAPPSLRSAAPPSSVFV